MITVVCCFYREKDSHTASWPQAFRISPKKDSAPLRTSADLSFTMKRQKVIRIIQDKQDENIKVVTNELLTIKADAAGFNKSNASDESFNFGICLDNQSKRSFLPSEPVLGSAKAAAMYGT